MSETIRAALIYLVQAVFDIYLFVLVIRLVLAWISADYTHPVTQLIVKLTNPLVKPLRKYIADYRKLETSTFVLLLLIDLVKVSIISLLKYTLTNPFGLLVLMTADIIQLFLQTFSYAILIQAIMSWIQPGSTMNSLLYQFTSPIMRPLQRYIPLVGGIDITPIPAIILLQLLVIVVVYPLTAIGMGIAFG